MSKVEDFYASTGPARRRPASGARAPGPRPSRHGGRRPGAGAPKGNLNGLKTGRYSRRVIAFKSALAAMPHTAQVLEDFSDNPRELATMGYALQYYGELLVRIATHGRLDDLSDPQLRRRLVLAITSRTRTLTEKGR